MYMFICLRLKLVWIRDAVTNNLSNYTYEIIIALIIFEFY